MTARKEGAEKVARADAGDPAREASHAGRQIALLTAIIRVFRETMGSHSEEEVAQVCLKVAEDLTGSAYGFIGELNSQGMVDTTTISQAGWKACKVPMPEAVQMLESMPHRGVNRVGLLEQKSWIINDVAHHPESTETPEGHPPIETFLGVPIRYSGGVVGLLALSGKVPGYTVEDQEDVEALSVAFAEALNRRRAEREVELLNRQLTDRLHQMEAAIKELESFSYSISHDLRAPVRHIAGYLELLEKQDLSSLDQKSRHYLQVVSSAAKRMGTLIDDLLAFSRLGRIKMARKPLDLGQLVQEVVREQASAVPGVEIDWVISPLPAVVGDRVMLRHVMTHLIANALKFSQSRPVIRIEIGAATDRAEETLIYVKDNGVGFDMRYKDKLFGLFQRLHALEEFEGTGVGLASVQRIVVRHGGKVWAEGELGKGATFWFSLPRGKEE